MLLTDFVESIDIFDFVLFSAVFTSKLKIEACKRNLSYNTLLGNIEAFVGSKKGHELGAITMLSSKEQLALWKIVSPSCSDFLHVCYWSGKRQDCSRLFRRMVTNVGYCCTFNSEPGIKETTETVIRHSEAVIALQDKLQLENKDSCRIMSEAHSGGQSCGRNGNQQGQTGQQSQGGESSSSQRGETGGSQGNDQSGSPSSGGQQSQGCQGQQSSGSQNQQSSSSQNQQSSGSQNQQSSGSQGQQTSRAQSQQSSGSQGQQSSGSQGQQSSGSQGQQSSGSHGQQSSNNQGQTYTACNPNCNGLENNMDGYMEKLCDALDNANDYDVTITNRKIEAVETKMADKEGQNKGFSVLFNTLHC